MMRVFPYPKSPKINVEQLRAISPRYQAQVIKVLFSILLFILTYLIVLALAIGIFLLSLVGAMAIISFLKGLYALLLVAAIVLSAGMFVYFIIKFLFQIKRDTDTSRIELQEQDQPDLFEFVRRVCEETEAPFPQKIFISPAVNACVFYNSSFLSMFLPVRKNLEIGAGLINCINLTEFKAILAHEFGHFSQSSTRLGSYTYRFNRVIHNLLYENEGWLNALNAIASTHAIMALFGQITIWLVRGVMELFVAVYKLINLNYLALSREMEFHADSVAVSVSGSAPIISALRRLEFGQAAYHYTIRGILDYQPDKATRARNFFVLHKENLAHMANLNDFPLEHGLPYMDEALYKTKTVEPRLRYKDVWSSHPDTDERKANAFKTEIPADIIYDSAWILFKNAEKLQEDLSARIHELEPGKKDAEVVDNAHLIAHMRAEEEKNKVNPVYNDYYTYSSNTFVAVPELTTHEKEALTLLEVQELFSKAQVEKLKNHYRDLSDTETMKMISEGHLQVKRFEFDGKKYTRYYSATIFKQLKNETDQQKEELEKYNQKISAWFYVHLEQKNPVQAAKYKGLLNFNHTYNNRVQKIYDLFQELIQFYHEHLVRHRQAEDVPYQLKKIKEIYALAVTAQKDLKELHLPEELRDEQNFLNGYRSLGDVTIANPASEENLNGFNTLYESLQNLTDKINGLTAELSRSVLKEQERALSVFKH